MAHLSLAILLKDGNFLHKAIGREDSIEGLNIDRIHGVLNLQQEKKTQALATVTAK